MKNLFYPSSISATVMLLLLIVLSPAMSSAACIGPPVINYFTATPNPVQGGPDGMLGPSHNVQLSWNISNADGIRLVADSGESGETTWLSPVINGMQLLLSKTHTFTLYARNECTAEADCPSRTITVEVRPVSLIPMYNLLLLQ